MLPRKPEQRDDKRKRSVGAEKQLLSANSARLAICDHAEMKKIKDFCEFLAKCHDLPTSVDLIF